MDFTDGDIHPPVSVVIKAATLWVIHNSSLVYGGYLAAA